MRTDATRILRVPRLRSNRVSDAGHRETHVNLFLGVPKRFRRDLSGRDCTPRSLLREKLFGFIRDARKRIISIAMLNTQRRLGALILITGLPRKKWSRLFWSARISILTYLID